MVHTHPVAFKVDMFVLLYERKDANILFLLIRWLLLHIFSAMRIRRDVHLIQFGLETNFVFDAPHLLYA